MTRFGARVTLVLGAGGPVGHAFHAGILCALHEFGWDPRSASRILGTSAGAQVASLLRAGMSGPDLFSRVTGQCMSEQGEAIARSFRRPEFSVSLWPWRAPTSTNYFRRLVARTAKPNLGSLLASVLPEGDVCLDDFAAGIDTMFGGRWPHDPLWIPAIEVASGDVVIFGKRPHVDGGVGLAVASSSAIPGVCRPVRIGDRAYVDGGVASTHHLAALEGDCDTVIISSPLSSFSVVARSVSRHSELLSRGGARVIKFEPSRAIVNEIGRRFMDASIAPRIARASRAYARDDLRDMLRV